MDLLIIRHAIAEERTEDKPDPARALTRKGRRRFKKVARGLDRLGIELARVIHSPWTRAAETALLLRPLVPGEWRDALVATDALTESPRPELLELLGAHAGAGTIAVVGHEPWLGQLVALLVVGDDKHGGRFPLKKGGVIRLDGDATFGGMAVRASLPPSVLRGLA